MPFQNLQLDTAGSFRPCCKALESIEKNGGGVFELPKDSIEEVWNSTYLQQLRQDFRKGHRPSTCQLCWEEEAAGVTSLRQNRLPSQSEIDKYIHSEDPTAPISLDLKPSNLCNLKCLICNPENSTSWYKEAAESLGFHKDNYKKYSAEKFDSKNSATLKEWFKQVRHLEIFGGEPFLMPEHNRILELAIASGESHHISLNYNSNGTFFSPKLLELWKNFKHIDLGFSIDGVGERFTLQRYPAKWDNVNKVIESFYNSNLEHLRLRFDISINVLNVFYMEELLSWTENFPKVHIIYNFVHRPFHYNIKCLPTEAKEAATTALDKCLQMGQKYKSPINMIKRFMFESDLNKSWSDFVNETQRLQRYRKQDVAQVFPALSPWIKG